MRTFLINTSPKQIDLSRVSDLIPGAGRDPCFLDVEWTEADGFERAICEKTFDVVQHAFGSDRIMDIVLFRQFSPGPSVRMDINDLMLDVMEQETQFVRDCADVFVRICKKSPYMRQLTFIFGEDCGHGFQETRAGITNHQYAVNDPGNIISVEDPTRMQSLFSVRYAYIDMDQNPRDRILRNKWHFSFQLTLFAYLLTGDQNGDFWNSLAAEKLNGASIGRAVAVPQPDLAMTAEMISRKIALLEDSKEKIKKNQVELPSDPKQRVSAENGQTESAEENRLPDVKNGEWSSPESFTPRMFQPWGKNRDDAQKYINTLIEMNKGNAAYIQKDYLTRIYQADRDGRASMLADALAHEVHEKTTLLDQQLQTLKKRLDDAKEPSFRVMPATGTGLGVAALLYALLQPSGLPFMPALLGLVASGLVAGSVIDQAQASRALFPEAKTAYDAFSQAWEGIRKQKEELQNRLKAYDKRDPADGKDRDAKPYQRQANWHIKKVQAMIDSLNQFSENIGIKPVKSGLKAGETRLCKICEGLQGNALIYYFSDEELTGLYYSGGQRQ